MQPTRREFMKQSGSIMLGAAGLGALSPQMLFGQASEVAGGKPTLIVLYLRGGADPLNTIVPHSDSQYYRIRPTIAIPRRQVIRINRHFGFHPAMRELAELYEHGLMAPILCAGSTHPTRSHFDAQDFMERAAPGTKEVTEGWLNRYLSATRSSEDRDLRSVSLQPVLPRSLRGEFPVLAAPAYGADHAMNVFESLYGCQSEKEAVAQVGDGSAMPRDAMLGRIMESGTQGIDKLRKLNGIIGAEAGDQVGYPDSHLGRQFRDLAKLIKAGEGLEVAAIDYNGWDHHAYQGGIEGTMSNMLHEVSSSIGAFARDLGPLFAKTLVLTMSEFGRTVRENGNNGSDHGRGGYMMAVGGPVRGGRIYGDWTGLDRGKLVDGRDLPVHVDFRLVFAETLFALFGFHADDHDFFPGYTSNARPLGFLKRMT